MTSGVLPAVWDVDIYCYYLYVTQRVEGAEGSHTIWRAPTLFALIAFALLTFRVPCSSRYCFIGTLACDHGNRPRQVLD